MTWKDGLGSHGPLWIEGPRALSREGLAREPWEGGLCSPAAVLMTRGLSIERGRVQDVTWGCHAHVADLQPLVFAVFPPSSQGRVPLGHPQGPRAPPHTASPWGGTWPGLLGSSGHLRASARLVDLPPPSVSLGPEDRLMGALRRAGCPRNPSGRRAQPHRQKVPWLPHGLPKPQAVVLSRGGKTFICL